MQEAAELHLVQYFAQVNLAALHRGRVTISKADFTLIKRIRGEQVDDDAVKAQTESTSDKVRRQAALRDNRWLMRRRAEKRSDASGAKGASQGSGAPTDGGGDGPSRAKRAKTAKYREMTNEEIVRWALAHFTDFEPGQINTDGKYITFVHPEDITGGVKCPVSKVFDEDNLPMAQAELTMYCIDCLIAATRRKLSELSEDTDIETSQRLQKEIETLLNNKEEIEKDIDDWKKKTPHTGKGKGKGKRSSGQKQQPDVQEEAGGTSHGETDRDASGEQGEQGGDKDENSAQQRKEAIEEEEEQEDDGNEGPSKEKEKRKEAIEEEEEPEDDGNEGPAKQKESVQEASGKQQTEGREEEEKQEDDGNQGPAKEKEKRKEAIEEEEDVQEEAGGTSHGETDSDASGEQGEQGGDKDENSAQQRKEAIEEEEEQEDDGNEGPSKEKEKRKEAIEEEEEPEDDGNEGPAKQKESVQEASGKQQTEGREEEDEAANKRGDGKELEAGTSGEQATSKKPTPVKSRKTKVTPKKTPPQGGMLTPLTRSRSTPKKTPSPGRPMTRSRTTPKKN
jgi:hypothetical protein